MTERALDEVGRLLSRRVGLRLDPAVRGRLARAVRAEAERCGEDEAAYASRLEADPELLQHLLNRVTVQETSFFRDERQFAALADHVLPRLAAEGGRVDVWSAGCSNGQEPYSLAMTLAESAIDDWRVIASDVSTDAVARTRAARYRERELRGLPDELRHRYLTRTPGADEWSVVPELRDRVTVERHNHAADPPPFPPGRCRVVFCRNVLIYFGHDDVVAFLDRLAAHVPRTAFLFLGYSESLWQVTDRFQLVRLGDAFVYQPDRAARRDTGHTGLSGLSGLSGGNGGGTTAPIASGTRPARTREPREPREPRPARPAVELEREPVPPSGVGDVMAEGEAALGAGDHATAVTAFRKATFLDPDNALAHLNLALALEVVGDEASARRAYAAARAALDRGDTAAVESTLEGYHLDDLIRLLDRKAVGG
ncbi:MAG TPA: protein-glutamate O-methyltransferase CheR [Acidimicrobiales bacterium]